MASPTGASSWRASVLPPAILVAGAIFGAVAEVDQLRYGDRPPVWVLGDFIGGATFLVAGAVAWSRRPANRIGPLLLAIGLAWFVGSYTRSSADWIVHLGRSFEGWWEPLIGALVLAYPSGRLAGRLDRLVIGAWLVNQAAWSAAQLVLLRPLSWYGCPTCPATVDAYIANRQLLDQIGPMTLAVGVSLAVIVVALAVRRLAVAGQTGRRRLAPVALAALALALGIAAPNGLRLILLPELYADPRIVALTYVIDTLAAVAVLAGLLQDRLARTAVADLVIDLRRDAVTIGADPRRLRDALARALGDASLELYLFDPQIGVYRDLAGAATDLPHGAKDRGDHAHRRGRRSGGRDRP